MVSLSTWILLAGKVHHGLLMVDIARCIVTSFLARQLLQIIAVLAVPMAVRMLLQTAPPEQLAGHPQSFWLISAFQVLQ